MGQFLGRRDVPCSVNPTFEIQIAQLHIDKVPKVKEASAIEHRYNILVSVFHAKLLYGTEFVRDIRQVAGNADNFPCKHLKVRYLMSLQLGSRTLPVSLSLT
jgi:hypothetical protein